jgi:hypothetical protein
MKGFSFVKEEEEWVVMKNVMMEGGIRRTLMTGISTVFLVLLLVVN